MVSLLFVFMVVLTVNAILAFSVQQYLSYAAFMAARAYQAAGSAPDDSKIAAQLTLASYIPGLPPAESVSGLGFPLKFKSFPRPLAFITQFSIPAPRAGDYGASATALRANPIQIKFRVPFAVIPIGEEIRRRFQFIEMSAQSYLGREVSTVECRAFFQGFLNKFRLQGPAAQKNNDFSNENSIYMEDNGC